jgi:hypothetical protein
MGTPILGWVLDRRMSEYRLPAGRGVTPTAGSPVRVTEGPVGIA